MVTEELRILVVDDERISRVTTVGQLREAGYIAEAVENAFQALERLEQDRWDVVITDLRMPGMDGLEFFKQTKRDLSDLDVILITAYGTVETVVEAFQEGVVDFLTKPFSFQELDVRLKKLEQQRATRKELDFLRATLDRSGAFCGLVGRSVAIRRIYDLIQLFADNPAPVLITGETGTGKELVGRALHTMSSRAGGPFVPIACGAIPKDLAESEMFGHEKGAFTGAIQRRKGSFERAHRGTLLLDDIDDLPLDIQVKLVRVLQEGKVQRVGGEEQIPVDVRVIASTKADLSQVLHEGRFREDMFYRLRGLEIRMPSLRERGEDIFLLAQHFLSALAMQEGCEPKTLSPEAANCLRRHPWPGNVRELRRVLESAAVMCRQPEIQSLHLPEYVRAVNTSQRLFTLHLADKEKIQFKDLMRQFEEQVIGWAMKVARGQQQKAAEILNLPRTTLQSKLNRKR